MATTITGQGYETMNGTTELGEFELISPPITFRSIQTAKRGALFDFLRCT